MAQADTKNSITAPATDDDPERFEHDPQMFVGCVGPTLIYIGVADRKTFDEIGAPCQDAGENENGHVLVKTGWQLGQGRGHGDLSHWIKSRTLDAQIADRRARS